jgi:hypothetical protein
MTCCIRGTAAPACYTPWRVRQSQAVLRCTRCAQRSSARGGVAGGAGTLVVPWRCAPAPAIRSGEADSAPTPGGTPPCRGGQASGSVWGRGLPPAIHK